MRRPLLSLVAVALLTAPSPAWAITYYAFGTFCSTCETLNAANQFYDDGLHDDGAAGDGLFGAIVTIDKPAGRYFWCAGADLFGVGALICAWPDCWCTPGGDAGYLWTSGSGDEIHFRFGQVTDPNWAGQWISAGPHGIPPGTHLAVNYGPFPGWCDYPVSGTGYPAEFDGTHWQRVVTIPTPGTYSMRFQTLEEVFNGDPVWFSEPYNAMCCAFGDCPKYVRFTTTQPNSDVRFQFDVKNGRMRGIELGPTPARTATWGSVKTIYR